MEGVDQLIIPPEVIDLIASEVTQPCNLLHLALACSAFRDTVIPLHLHYRIVERAIDDGTFWEHLQENPRRLQNIRSLKLFPVLLGDWFERRDDNERRFPPGHPEDNLRLFDLQLLSEMTRLVSFHWDDRSTQYLPEGELFRSFNSLSELVAFQDILWTRLITSCSQLEALHIVGKLGSWHCPTDITIPGRQQVQYPPPVLPNLRSLCITIPSCHSPTCSQQVFNAHLTHFTPLLRASNGLRTLRIHSTGDLLHLAMLNGQIHFPELEELYVQGISFSAPRSGQDWAEFLGSHPSIRKLRWVTYGSFRPAALESSATIRLPSLTHLSGRAVDVASFLKPLSNGAYRPLTSLSSDGALVNPASDLACIGLTVRDLSLTDPLGTNPAQFLEVNVHYFPHLRRLKFQLAPVGFRLSGSLNDVVSETHFSASSQSFTVLQQVPSCLRQMGALPELRIFSLDRVEAWNTEEIVTCIEVCLERLPKLRFLFLPGELSSVVLLAPKDEGYPSARKSPSLANGEWETLKWALYENLVEDDFRQSIERLIETDRWRCRKFQF